LGGGAVYPSREVAIAGADRVARQVGSSLHLVRERRGCRQGQLARALAQLRTRLK